MPCTCAIVSCWPNPNASHGHPSTHTTAIQSMRPAHGTHLPTDTTPISRRLPPLFTWPAACSRYPPTDTTASTVLVFPAHKLCDLLTVPIHRHALRSVIGIPGMQLAHVTVPVYRHACPVPRVSQSGRWTKAAAMPRMMDTPQLPLDFGGVWCKMWCIRCHGTKKQRWRKE